MSTGLSLTIDTDGVATLAIDVPGASMNVLNEALLDALEEAVETVIADPKIVGALIVSEKPDFLAGADLKMMQRFTDADMDPAEVLATASRLSRLLRRLETGGQPARALAKGEAFAKPVAAAVTGQCLGGGFEIALACHHRVAAPDAVFGLPEVMVGLLPGGGGTQRLPRLVGIGTALQSLTTGRSLKAEKAAGLGVTEIAPSRGEAIEAARAWVLANPQALAPWDRRGFRYPGGGGAMHPGSVQTFIGANAMALGETRGAYPAVRAILSSVYHGSIVDVDTALRIESKQFAKLIMGPVSAAMIRTLFINKQAAEKGAARPTSVPPTTLNTLGVLGAGLMGAGIAYEAARAGVNVVLIDQNAEAAARGKAYSQRLVDKGVERGRMSAEDGAALLARITPSADYAPLSAADLVIEAVFEDVAVKASVFEKAAAVLRPDVVFASNTSTLPITELQQHWPDPSAFLGMHFFSPVEKMPLLEIIRGEASGERAIAAALDFARLIKKTPILVNDGRGFYTSRCVIAFADEGARLVHEGVNPALIENAGRAAGYPMGPLQLTDSTNLDLGLRVARATKAALGDRYEPGPGYDALVTLVETHGRLGMKNQKGYYDYADGDPKPQRLWPDLGQVFPAAPDQPSLEDVRDRLLYRQLAEVLQCRVDGVLTTPQDGDLGAILGWGFPPFTGGPFSLLDILGLDAYLARADDLAARFGPRFSAPAEIAAMRDAGARFYPPSALESAA